LWRDVLVTFIQEAVKQLFNGLKNGLKNRRQDTELRAFLDVAA
jgi:hypothetical protein